MSVVLGTVTSKLSKANGIRTLNDVCKVRAFVGLFVPSTSTGTTIAVPVVTPCSSVVNLSQRTAIVTFRFNSNFAGVVAPYSNILVTILSVTGVSCRE